MFHSMMYMLYYNESLISYNHSDGERIMEIARALQGREESRKPVQFDTSWDRGSSFTSDREELDPQPLATWIVILISVATGFALSCLAMLPLYRKLYFPQRHDSALKGRLDTSSKDQELRDNA